LSVQNTITSAKPTRVSNNAYQTACVVSIGFNNCAPDTTVRSLAAYVQ